MTNKKTYLLKNTKTGDTMRKGYTSLGYLSQKLLNIASSPHKNIDDYVVLECEMIVLTEHKGSELVKDIQKRKHEREKDRKIRIDNSQKNRELELVKELAKKHNLKIEEI